MKNENENQIKWWGQFDIPVNSAAQWQIESLLFGVHHVDKEWQIAYERLSNDDSLHNQIRFTKEMFDHRNYSNTTRHVFRKSSSMLELKPQLADRTVVTRPSTPISLAPGEEVTLYISTPLWVQFEVGGKKDSAIEDLAINRPSDTWFGSSTREGELCYASQTTGRLNLDNLPTRPSRAITPLVVVNHAEDKLLLQRIALPVPLLSLFSTPEGILWTQPATLIRDDDGGMAELKLGKEAPKEAKDAVRINKARRQPEKGMLVRAFSSIFDKGI
tara:strand:- start:10216 stop:11034 length:819 start_codon:yes stop_codon:yes gene_type:complete